MAALKKGFLVLAVVLLGLAGASGTANAQHFTGGLITCAANSAPTIVRAEGIAEILGDIVLNCIQSNIGGGVSGTVVLTNFAVTLNTNVTNNRDFGPPDGNSGPLPSPTSRSNVTDAVLIMNENTSLAPTATPNVTPGLFGGTLGQTPQYGILRRPGENTLVWDGVNVTPPPFFGGIAGELTTTIRISNIRGNASIFAAGDLTFPSAQLTAVVSVTGTTNLTVTGNVLNVGSPLRGLSLLFRAVQFSDTPPFRVPITLAQCRTQCIDSDGNFIDSCLRDHTGTLATGAGAAIPLSAPITNEFSGAINTCVGGAPCALGPPTVSAITVRLSEGFATAFKTLGVPTNFPGLTQVEDGFTTPPSGINGGGATQGTRFIFKFFNVPDGVRVFTPISVTGTQSTIGFSRHTLTIVKLFGGGVDAQGAGGIVLGGFGIISTSKEVAITGGSGFTVYEVIDDNPFVVEAVIVPVVFAFRSDTANNKPAVGSISMSVNFAPLSTVVVSSGPDPEPRFVETNTPRTVATIAKCITNILFPFVTNQAGFDTGFSIANTSKDDKNTTCQGGRCTLNFFGTTTGGGAAPSQQTSSVLNCGQTMVWTLSGGNAAFNIVGTPGFQGYIFAACEFQFAHGFAFITDGFGGVPTLAEGYLALVVPWDGIADDRINTSSASGVLGFGIFGEALGH